MELQKHTILEIDKKKKRKNLTLKEELSMDGKTLLMLRVERKVGRDIRAFLKFYYVEKKLSWDKIAVLAGISVKAARLWGNQFGIKSRSKAVATKLFKKEYFRTATKYKHISCCLCQRCKAISGQCGFDPQHKKGYCVFSCVNFTDEAH